MRSRIVGLGPDRLRGVDLARGLAMLGMFAAHTLTRSSDAETLVDGRSSVLFATLAGVSIGLMTGGARPLPRPARAAARVRLATRGLVLVGMGLLLRVPRTDIAVILDYYGVLFLLALPLVFARRRVLALAAAGAAVCGPLLVSLVASGPRALRGSLVAEWLLTGYYPALVWLAYVCAGIVAARSDLARVATLATLAAVGAACALAGYGAGALVPGVDASAHSNTTAEALGSGGVALVVLACCCALARVRAVRALTWPLAAVGSMPLSVYAVQLLVLSGWILAHGDAADVPYPLELFLALAVGSLVAASAWRLFLGRGPLERLLPR